jgi:K+-transporting ATPase A subunit
MSNKPRPHADAFASISTDDLDKVSGGAARVTARSSSANSEITALLTQVTSSIKDLASQPSGGMDPMMMMMMMMMMGGGGGGAAAAPAPAPQPQQPPVINISTSVKRGW